MSKLMADKTAIHAPTLPPKKLVKPAGNSQKLVGKLVKGGRKPKGSINVPQKPSDPRLRTRVAHVGVTPPDSRPFPRDPRLRPSFKAATKLNKSRIFSLSSDDEVNIEANSSKINNKNPNLARFYKLMPTRDLRSSPGRGPSQLPRATPFRSL